MGRVLGGLLGGIGRRRVVATVAAATVALGAGTVAARPAAATGGGTTCWKARATSAALARAVGRAPAACTHRASAAHRYRVSGWYRSTGPGRLLHAHRTGSGWRADGTARRLAGTHRWTRFSWTSAALPAGSAALSVGTRGKVRLRGLAFTDAGAGGRSPGGPTPGRGSAPGGSSRLPARVAATYWTNWGRGTPLDQLPAGFNLLFVAFAYGDGSGTGRVVFRPDDGSGVSPAQFLGQVRHAQAAGDRVVLSLGGANPVGLKLLTDANVDQLVTSVSAIVDTYGFDGVDWDLEQADIYTVANLLAATRAWKQRYGTDFLVTATPAPSSVPYKQFAQQAGPLLDYLAPQYYDYADPNRLAGIRSRTAELVTRYGVPASKIGIGAKVGSDAASAPASFWRDAVASMRALYPSFRGASVWEATRERTAGNPFATTVVPTLLR